MLSDEVIVTLDYPTNITIKLTILLCFHCHLTKTFL